MNSCVQNIEERQAVREMLDKPGWDDERQAKLEKFMRSTLVKRMNRMLLTTWNFGAGLTRSNENGRRNDQKNS